MTQGRVWGVLRERAPAVVACRGAPWRAAAWHASEARALTTVACVCCGHGSERVPGISCARAACHRRAREGSDSFWLQFRLAAVPLSLVEKVSALRFTSLSGVLALVYLVVAMSVHFGIDASLEPPQTTGDIALFTFGESTASAGAIVLFAYTCQMNIPSIYFVSVHT